ncbi:alpha/beta hydrolase [Halosegnis marinus]|uniref:alpha/beta hydrolase n=1 Tax=Halosegnis marinus TaxID=3034023 RepID=UPI0036144FA4
MSIDPHADEPIRTAGAPPQAAEAAVVLLHGRGDSPEGILRLVDDVYRRGVLYVAPAAAGRVWYPGGFAEPVTERREAFVESALGQVERALALAAETGIAPDRTVLAGFSQGAAVAAEYATRRPERFGGLGLLAGACSARRTRSTPATGRSPARPRSWVSGTRTRTSARPTSRRRPTCSARWAPRYGPRRTRTSDTPSATGR